MGVCTVEDVAWEDGVSVADARGAAAETLDATSGVVSGRLALPPHKSPAHKQ